MASRAVPAPGPFSLAILEAVSVWRSGEAGIGGALEARHLGAPWKRRHLVSRPRQDQGRARLSQDQGQTSTPQINLKDLHLLPDKCILYVNSSLALEILLKYVIIRYPTSIY